MNQNHKPFTIVLPIRATELELKFVEKSLPSAFKINPDEIIIGVDDDIESEKIRFKVAWLAGKYNFPHEKMRIIKVLKSDSWNFQLANVIWECYTRAKNDVILSFDVDSTLRPEVMVGLDQIGNDNVAILSFTKRLRIKTFGELIRFIFYRWRVKHSKHVFSGVYWVYRPYYFDLIKLEKYKAIHNGVDTIIVNEILGQDKYKLVTRKEMGVNAMDIQNEDLPWRQFQTGVWIFANQRMSVNSSLTAEFYNRKQISMETANGGVSRLARRIRLLLPELKIKMLHMDGSVLQKIALKYMSNKPLQFALIKSFVYWHPYLLRGYLWAKRNQDSETVKVAKTMRYEDWGLFGSKYLPDMNWNRLGTGFVK